MVLLQEKHLVLFSQFSLYSFVVLVVFVLKKDAP